MTTITNVPIDQIKPGDNDRRVFNQVALQELADSIAANGLAQPITVRPVTICPCCGRRESDDTQDDLLPAFVCQDCGGDEMEPCFEIVAGERRFRAVSDILQWATIPAIVRVLDDEQADSIMLAENVHRVDLNPVDEASAYAKRMERHGWSVAETARHANVSDSRVANRLKLLDLTPEIQHMVANGNLGLGFAQVMSKLNGARQFQVMAWLRDQSTPPTLRVFSKVVNELYAQQVQEAMFDLSQLLTPQVAAAVEDSKNGKLYEMLPTVPDLPELPTRLGGIGRLLDDFAAELIAQGKNEAARIIVDFWVKAMRANYAIVNPFESKTLAALLSK